MQAQKGLWQPKLPWALPISITGRSRARGPRARASCGDSPECQLPLPGTGPSSVRVCPAEAQLRPSKLTAQDTPSFPINSLENTISEETEKLDFSSPPPSFYPFSVLEDEWFGCVCRNTGMANLPVY